MRELSVSEAKTVSGGCGMTFCEGPDTVGIANDTSGSIYIDWNENGPYDQGETIIYGNTTHYFESIYERNEAYFLQEPLLTS